MRDVNNTWVRMEVHPGDFFEWPAGIYHRFVVSNPDNSITAMRLFKGVSPVWTAHPRSEVQGNHTPRNDYVDMYLCGVDPDEPAEGWPGDTGSAASMMTNRYSLLIALTLLAVSVGYNVI